MYWLLPLQLQNETSTLDTTLKGNLDTNMIIKPGCKFERNRRIICTNDVYKDKKVWLESRHNIDYEIQKLRSQLDYLKEIRKHLKRTRPSDDLNSTDLNTYNDLSYQSIPISIDTSGELPRPNLFGKKKKKRPHHQDFESKDILIQVVLLFETERNYKVSSLINQQHKVSM